MEACGIEGNKNYMMSVEGCAGIDALHQEIIRTMDI